jgi:hypothetical protein
VTEVVECLPSKCKALISTSIQRKEEGEEENGGRGGESKWQPF